MNSQMKGITIQDSIDGFLSFDLKDILAVIGPQALSSKWEIHNAECSGECSQEIHDISDTLTKISGKRLLQLAEGLTQVIEGLFLAINNDAEKPWLRIRAVDSSGFDVTTGDPTVISKLKEHFHFVSDFVP